MQTVHLTQALPLGIQAQGGNDEGTRQRHCMYHLNLSIKLAFGYKLTLATSLEVDVKRRNDSVPNAVNTTNKIIQKK